MTREAIDAILKRHHAAFAARDPVALAADHLPDGEFQSPAAGLVRGRPAIEQIYRYWTTAYPDMQFTWDAPLIDDNRAALFWTFTGTVNGPFFGVAIPGTHIEMVGAAEYVFRDDGIALARHVFDFSAVLMKAGILKARPA